jgi:hypothetical protein
MVSAVEGEGHGLIDRHRYGFRRGVAIIAAVNSDGLAFHDLARAFDVRPWRRSTHGRIAPMSPVPAIRTRLQEPTLDEGQFGRQT